MTPVEDPAGRSSDGLRGSAMAESRGGSVSVQGQCTRDSSLQIPDKGFVFDKENAVTLKISPPTFKGPISSPSSGLTLDPPLRAPAAKCTQSAFHIGWRAVVF